MTSDLAQGGLDSYSPEYLAEDIGHRLVHASIAAIVVTTTVYTTFLTSRLLYAERNYWEIWVLYPLSYLLCLALCTCGILIVEIAGSGRHMVYWLINDQSNIVRTFKIQTALEFLYMAGVTFPKVAILVLYLKIFVERKIRIITWLVTGVVLSHWVATGVIGLLVACQPFAYKWEKTIPDGHCGVDLVAAYKYGSIPNILTDLAIAILPVSSLYHLQISRIRKIGVFLTFLAGSLGIIISIVRFVEFYKADLESDFMYLGVNTAIFTVIEPCSYFICACLPGIRPLVQELYKRLPRKSLVSKGHIGGSSSTKRLHNFPTGGHEAHNYTSRSDLHSRRIPTAGENKSGFINLQETVRVDYSSAAMA